MHIRIFDLFIAFDSDSLSFSSQLVGDGAAVFRICQICAFHQMNTVVFTSKCKIKMLFKQYNKIFHFLVARSYFITLAKVK